MQFENDPLNSEITETGNILAEDQRKRWQQILHTSAEKRGNHQQTVKLLRATPTAMQGDS